MKTESKENRNDIMWRGYVLYGVMLLGALFILGKAFYIHFAQKDQWEGKMEKMSIKLRTVEATRGNICASDGRLLATSVPYFDIRMDVASPNISDELFSSEVGGLAEALSALFKDRTAYEYKRLLLAERRKGNRYFLIKRNVTYDQLKMVRNFPLFEKGQNAGGLIAVKKERRVMPFNELAKRTIGFQSKDKYVGLEGAYSQFLQGRSGQRLERRIASGYWIPVDEDNMVEPQNGKDVITTIDINFQDVAESALADQLDSSKAEHGCAILMEVATGNIRAIANLTRDTATGEYKEDYNYAIGEASEPGSTFKLISLIAALDDGLIDLDDTVNTGNGEYTVHGATMRDAHKGGYGRINVQTVFEKSSNIGVLKLIHQSYGQNPRKFIEHVYKMGMGKPLGLTISGEGAPYIKYPSDKSWSAISLRWMSVGYEVKVTPLQLLTFYNAVANNGKMVKPQFVQEIRQAGKTIQTFEPEVIVESIASERTLVKARAMLEGVVLRGTARNLRNASMPIGGKTGTAQVHSSAGYNKSDYKASFVGYFPADKPMYSCIVVINNPRGAYYGSLVAAPVFKEIAEKVFSSEVGIRDIRSDTTMRSIASVKVLALSTQSMQMWKGLASMELPKPMSELVRLTSDSVGWSMQEVSLPSDQIPDLAGMGLRSAMAVIENRGIRLKVYGMGKVYQQSLAPGTPINRNMELIIWLR